MSKLLVGILLSVVVAGLVSLIIFYSEKKKEDSKNKFRYNFNLVLMIIILIAIIVYALEMAVPGWFLGMLTATLSLNVKSIMKHTPDLIEKTSNHFTKKRELDIEDRRVDIEERKVQIEEDRLDFEKKKYEDSKAGQNRLLLTDSYKTKKSMQ